MPAKKIFSEPVTTMDLRPLEVELIETCRELEFGTLELIIMHGQPRKVQKVTKSIDFEIQAQNRAARMPQDGR
jgi:hypothetical protein